MRLSNKKKILNEEELERLINTYGNEILRLCTYYLRDEYLAEDALQETFVKVWQKYSTYDGSSDEKTWITEVAKNTCKKYLKVHWYNDAEVSEPMAGEEKLEDCYKQLHENMKKDILNATVRNIKSSNRLRTSRIRTVAVAFVAVMCLGAIAVGVGNISKLWDELGTKKSGEDEKTQEQSAVVDLLFQLEKYWLTNIQHVYIWI